ncbi:MAG: hypothetical protein AAF449_20600, partial [Myxococcota bacterium]
MLARYLYQSIGRLFPMLVVLAPLVVAFEATAKPSDPSATLSLRPTADLLKAASRSVEELADAALRQKDLAAVEKNLRLLRGDAEAGGERISALQAELESARVQLESRRLMASRLDTLPDLKTEATARLEAVERPRPTPAPAELPAAIQALESNARELHAEIQQLQINRTARAARVEDLPRERDELRLRLSTLTEDLQLRLSAARKKDGLTLAERVVERLVLAERRDAIELQTRVDKAEAALDPELNDL